MTDGAHDMGGMHGFGAVATPGSERVSEHPWELRVFALSTLVGIERLGFGSGRAIREEMEPAHYLAAGYYERWLSSTEERVLRRGTIAEDELDAWVERIRTGEDVPVRRDPERARAAVDATTKSSPLAPAGSARFGVGEAVRVKRMRPAGHTRCPRYVRGVAGQVEAIRGLDALPDIGPYEGPDEPVYAVAFSSEALFGWSAESSWTVFLDLFESYLEPV
ncbi:MAG: nitrile hydratase subunit beta [Actinobacteria bacterium]|nr:nitrile hydratase subunit beta [Actinomycetota bacterium]